MSRRLLPAVWVLLLIFTIRLACGVVSEFWGDDERQIYLIGLKAFTTGEWPYFGPDVVYTQTRIPGALQALLIAGPLWLVPQPEAPYVLLNLLSCAALTALGAYIAIRQPGLPRWWLWTSVFFSPWTLDVSAHVYNPSYVLPGAVAFVVSACELIPSLSAGVLRRLVAAFGLGFGVLWVYQLHLSGSLLGVLAVVVLALAIRARPRSAVQLLAGATAGAFVGGATLIPTVWSIGLGGVLKSTGANVVFEPANLLRLPQVAAQVLSLATIELPRFLGANTQERLAFLIRYWWAAPAIVIGVIGGILQTGYLFVRLCLGTGEAPGWRPLRNTMAAVLVLVGLSFALSVRAPASHALYVLLPLVFIYAAACWDPILRIRVVRVLAVILLASNLIAQLALAARNFTDRSLYVHRAVIVRAIAERNYHLVGERRWE
jgi:hypothetical protein